jgi:hypothetical protein
MKAVETLARYISKSKRASYEADGWRIIEYNHCFLKGVLALKDIK